MTRWFARTVVAVAVALGVVVGTGGIATAHDAWPPIPPPGSTPIVPFDTKDFLTPDDPDYWNPLYADDRLTSPYGTSTRIVCTAFHGVLLECWQADGAGNPHKLVRLPFNFPAIVGWEQPGGGPSHFVYPFWHQ